MKGIEIMKAIVRTGLEAGEMYLKDLPLPNISEDEVLVRVKAVGICGTDAHEFSGIVEKIGANVNNIKEGDRVVSRLNLGVCGVCRACLTGNPHMCEHRTCPGFKLDGAYAEYIKMDPKMLVKISDNVTYEQGALVEPMAIVAHALLQRTKVESEDFVVIYGPGPIGLIALQMIKINGASKVIMVGTDVDENERLPLAEKLGADYVFNSQKKNIEEEIRKIKNVSELSPNDFIQLIRLKRSAELIKERKYQISEIAYMTGFSSPNYFSKIFFNQFGVNPKDF